MSVESVQLLEQAMIDAGFDVIFDSTFSDIDNIKKGAKDCVSVLKELKEQGKIDSDVADFNFKTTDIEDAKTQIQQAKDLLTEFTNEDGTVNLELEGAQEDMIITCNRSGDLSIYNELLDCTMLIRNCSVGEVITIKGDSQIISTTYSSHNICNDFNYEFFKIGNTIDNRNNRISVSSPCKIVIRYSPIIKDTP